MQVPDLDIPNINSELERTRRVRLWKRISKGLKNVVNWITLRCFKAYVFLIK